ncbi:MAG: RagB/SusD family nutrient uptake outer membrane protein [Prevotella sp.]|nr:RagB/SusD family nutrient uptake outer membrane protein [Prevotella sp.]
MKRKLIYIAAGFVCAVGLVSCQLDEYNPSAGSATLENYDTWAGLQTQCYSTLYHELYSKSDFLFLSECGTDLWLNPASTEYSSQVFYYTGLGVERSEPQKTWQQAYSVIATCNSVINNAENVNGGNSENIKVLAAEAKCIRAFMHLTLVTYFGPITLCTTEVGIVNTAPTRNSLEEVYSSITTDLQEAAADLGVEPFGGNYARVTKKTALGLLARAYAQGAGEGLEENGVSYWQRAKEVAEDMITNASSYGMYLYDDVSDLWAQENNRQNKEALFVAAGLDATNGDAGSGLYNNSSSYLYAYIKADPNKCSDIYGTQSASNSYLGNHSQGGVMAPTKHAIDVFDEWDKRYENTFLTAYGQFTMEGSTAQNYKNQSLRISSTTCNRYGISTEFSGDSIHPYVAMSTTSEPGGTQPYALGVYPKGNKLGENAQLETSKNVFVIDYPLAVDEDRFPIYLSKTDLSAEEKAQRRYFCMNISDLFDADGNYSEDTYRPGTMATSANLLFPSLIKYNWCYDGVTRHLSTDSYDFRNGDIFIMRSAEIYLIAAEAEVMLGNSGAAASYLRTLRQRAVRTGYTMTDISSPTEQDILDEYAREFAGEHMRWPVLKRHRANGLMKSALANYNKLAYAGFDESIHYCRPIPKLFLDQISNAEEYGDNVYGYTANKGY